MPNHQVLGLGRCTGSHISLGAWKECLLWRTWLRCYIKPSAMDEVDGGISCMKEILALGGALPLDLW